MPGIWIQRADFSSDESPEVTPDEALSVLEATDWTALVEQKQERIRNGMEYCDPGFGIVFADGEIIHLIEPVNEPFDGFYHYRAHHRRFGIFSGTRNHTAIFEGLRVADLHKAVREWTPVDPESTIAILNARDA